MSNQVDDNVWIKPGCKEKSGKGQSSKGGSNRGSKGSRGARSPLPPAKRVRYPWCGKFNKVGGCTNSQTDDASVCKAPDGKKYRHSCDVRVPPNNKHCGRYDHSRQTHP